MKKILSLGVASAVLAMTAVAASADITPVITGTTVGETVTVEIVAKDVAAAAIEFSQFTVSWSDKLTLTNSVPTAVGNAAFNAETGKFAWMSTTALADDAVLLTLTFTSTAVAGDEVAVTLKAEAGSANVSEIPATVIVAEAVDPVLTDDVTDPTVEETIEVTVEDTIEVTVEDTAEVTVEDTAEVTTDASTTDDAAATTDDDNVPTGVELAIIPAVLAGAAAIVAKKRK